MSGIIPLSGMVDNALKLKQDDSLWIGIGRTSAWSNESVPPAESTNATTLDQPIAYKQVELTSLVVPDVAGSIVFLTSRYRTVLDADALTEVARWCYIKAAFNYEETNTSGSVVGVTTFRQTGLFSGLTPASGFEAETVLTPAQVTSPGRLIFLANHVPRTRDLLLRDIIEIVREFKA